MNFQRIYLWLGLLLSTTITFALLVQHHFELEKTYGWISQIFTPAIGFSSFITGFVISLLLQWGIRDTKFLAFTKILNKDERKIIEILYQQKQIPQAQLGALAELSRVKTSRIISSFEKKGVIIKEQIGEKNIIHSHIYKSTSNMLKSDIFTGITEKKLVISFFLIFLLGITLSLLNGIHVIELDHPMRPINYIFSAESLALGGLSVSLLRKKISKLNLEKLFQLLPEDESVILRLIFACEKITQMEIQQQTGIHKMKVSRVISKFHQKGIIEKKPYGNTNLIILTM